ncbi:GNAT family N-acetyltransferase [Lederbergia panacisoli]|uniref:GNAT family N-acetyltransferase n=1 Tax=Lederbergia panacisoli TaxID=1255251 RepID=UPI00214C0E35|nr:GNAT family N-acetyltransferase [Lederbergia panacisoli]MCR2822121.1 GNAT family N-acetyltransferase [Lederbergia panacisoli]
MTTKEMLHIVQSQLAIDLNCTIDDLNGENDSIIFVEAKVNTGCRPFRRKARYFEIVSMGKSIVVSATPERLLIAKTQMQGKDRDAIFSLPFIRGLYVHYLPDLERIKPIFPPENFSFELIEKDRNLGLASYLVNKLTFKIVELGDIPSYDVIASNLASQRVAQRSGYFPGWVSDWRCNFERLETLPFN